jgi:hypothetical protein
VSLLLGVTFSHVEVVCEVVEIGCSDILLTKVGGV